MNAPRVTGVVERSGEVDTDRSSNRVPPQADTRSNLDFGFTPVIESVAGVNENGSGPFLQDLELNFGTSRNYMV